MRSLLQGNTIPGHPNLMSRGKDGVLGFIIDHYGVLFATCNPPAPDDYVIDFGSNGPRETTYLDFCSSNQPTFYPAIRPDSIVNVLVRALHVLTHPEEYDFLNTNCEHIARYVMTGIKESTQVANGVGVALGVSLGAFVISGLAGGGSSAKRPRRSMIKKKRKIVTKPRSRPPKGIRRKKRRTE